MKNGLHRRWSLLPGSQRILLRGSAGSLLVKGSSLIALFGLHVLLAKLLGVSEYGSYNYAMSWVNVLMVVGLLGEDTAAVKYFPRYQVAERWDLLRGFLRRSVQVTTGMSLIVVVVFLALVPRLAGSGAAAQSPFYWFAASGLLVLVALETLFSASLRGFKEIVWSLAPGQLGRPLLLAAFLLLAFRFGGRRIDATEALSGHILAACFSVSALWLLLRRRLPARSRTARPSYLTREWLVVSVPMLLIASFNVLLGRLDVLMIGALTDARQTGVYAAASQIARLVTMGLMSVGMIAAPYFSELSSRNEHEELRRTLRLSARVALGISFPIFLIVTLGTTRVLGLFGEGYLSGALVLKLLACSQLVNVLAGPAGYLMVMTGHQVPAAGILGGSALIHLLLNVLLIPRMGIMGAATATAFSTLLWNVLMVGFCARSLGQRTTAF